MDLESKAALQDVFAKVINYIEEVSADRLKVTGSLSPEQLKKEIDLTIDEEGEISRLPEYVDSYLSRAVRTGSPRFVNQLFSGFSLPGFTGDMIAALTNTSMYTYEAAPIATVIEKSLITRMAAMAGFPNGEGSFVTGGSNANLIAMFAARNRQRPEIKEKGWTDSKPLVVFVSKSAHYSFGKAANLLGIGLDNLIKVDTNSVGQMEPLKLAQAIERSLKEGKEPFFVGATAGTTVEGAFDPFEPIADLCEKYRLWFHVDGAWGGSLLLSDKQKRVLSGLQRADSFVWDAHKMMGLPLICSVVLFKEKNTLQPLNTLSGTHYLLHDESEKAWDLGNFSIQCGRRVDALKLWFAWKCCGTKGFGRKIDSLFELADYAEKQIAKSSSFELLIPRQSLNLCFRYIPQKQNLSPEQIDSVNLRAREKLSASGEALINYSILGGRFCFRYVAVSFDAKKETFDLLLDDILQFAAEAEGELT